MPPSGLRAAVLFKYRLLEAGSPASLSSEVLLFWLKKDARDERPSSSSGSGKDELRFTLLSSRHQDADLGNTPAVHKEHQTELTHFEDNIPS